MPAAVLPGSSGTLIHHAYHLHRFETVTGRFLLELQEIIEFGGGYGSMARLLARLGYRGRYHIHDLPEFAALQRFYLRMVQADTQASDLRDALARVTSAHSEHRGSGVMYLFGVPRDPATSRP
jgi:hypothetical protein